MSSYTNSHHFAMTTPLKTFRQIEGQRRADICVVGAGYTGLSVSLHLAELGFNVVLLEGKRVGWGASGRSGGQLGYGMTPMQPDLMSKYGEEGARRFWEISASAVDLFHSLCLKHNIECDFKNGNMACAVSQSDLDYLNDHVEIIEGYGRKVYDSYDRVTTENITGSDVYAGSIISENAGHLNPQKYAFGLTKAANNAGVAIFENSKVLELNNSGSLEVMTETGSVVAENVVLCCNGYLGKLNPTLANRILPVDNYQIATEPLDDQTLGKLVNNGACVWDTHRSVHYFRVTPDHRLVMGCGIGIPNYPPKNLEKDCRKHLQRIYPFLKNVKIDYIWGGILAGTVNQLPDVGRLAENIFYAQGYSGHGVGLAPLVGKLMALAIHEGCDDFDFLAKIKHKNVPGGRFLRFPAVLSYRLMTNTLDKLAWRR